MRSKQRLISLHRFLRKPLDGMEMLRIFKPLPGGDMEQMLFATVDAMLEPAALSVLGSLPVRTMRCLPLHNIEANSGSTFHRVETNNRQGPHYILKRIPAIVNGTTDNRYPSVMSWQHGLLHRLPSEIIQVTAACAYDGGGYALLMHDVRGALLRGNEPFTQLDNARFLDAMAALHAAFWEDPHLSNPRLGLYRPCHFYPRYSAQTPHAAEGWAHLEQFVAQDVATPIRTLLHDPTVLCDALMRYPLTLVHNDLWWANLGIRREPQAQVIMLDWDFATLAPPAVDLAFYLGENAGLLPMTKEEVIAYYRKSLVQRVGSRFDDQWWLPQLELGLLGCFLRRGHWLLLAASHAIDENERSKVVGELDWWSQHVQRGIQQLETS